jgi:hypothetical protein
MSILATCPACGFESPEIRCPRCNALKVVGCNGVCSVCGSSCKTGSVPAPPGAPRPSEDAADDAEHPGTPLDR